MIEILHQSSKFAHLLFRTVQMLWMETLTRVNLPLDSAADAKLAWYWNNNPVILRNFWLWNHVTFNKWMKALHAWIFSNWATQSRWLQQCNSSSSQNGTQSSFLVKWKTKHGEYMTVISSITIIRNRNSSVSQLIVTDTEFIWRTK